MAMAYVNHPSTNVRCNVLLSVFCQFLLTSSVVCLLRQEIDIAEFVRMMGYE